MSYTGKYALAKHETLALKCEDLERQLAEAREENTELIIKLKAHKKEALTISENIKFRELKEKGDD